MCWSRCHGGWWSSDRLLGALPGPSERLSDGCEVILVTPALVPTDGAPQRLLARVGSGHATRTLLTGELRSPERSHQIGLTDVLMSGRGAALATTSCCPQQAPRRNVGRRWSKSGPLTGQAQEALCTSPRPDDHRTCEPSSRNRPMSSPARVSARTIATLCATSPSSRSSWREDVAQLPCPSGGFKTIVG
jgi:hypothetical protein